MDSVLKMKNLLESTMEADDLTFHYVSTHDEAFELIRKHSEFWVSNCGCRERRGWCDRSRLDLCLFFKPDMGGTGSEFRKVDREFAYGIFEEAKRKRLVTRPFRDEIDMKETQGICFCCDDCCDYFTNPEAEGCDRGRFIERTDLAECNHCGDCVNVCYFNAREMTEEGLHLNTDRCYGCGLCASVCPVDCIRMNLREEP